MEWEMEWEWNGKWNGNGTGTYMRIGCQNGMTGLKYGIADMYFCRIAIFCDISTTIGMEWEMKWKWNGNGTGT